MKNLKQISKEYESLQEAKLQEMNTYFENKVEEDLAEQVRSGNFPKWKLMEKECELKENLFVQSARKYGEENKLTDRDLVVKISKEIIQTNQKSINHFLLIRLMWEIRKEKGHFCLDTLEDLIIVLLKSDQVTEIEEYYLESYIDIWNYDSDEPIPIDILERIILLEPKIDSHGALIKAVCYLSNHPKGEKEKVLAKARKTKSYKEDESYQDWIE